MDQAVGGRSKIRIPPTAVLGWQALARDKTWPGCSNMRFCIHTKCKMIWNADSAANSGKIFLSRTQHKSKMKK